MFPCFFIFYVNNLLVSSSSIYLFIKSYLYFLIEPGTVETWLRLKGKKERQID